MPADCMSVIKKDDRRSWRVSGCLGRSRSALVALLLVTGVLGAVPTAVADDVTDWNEALLKTFMLRTWDPEYAAYTTAIMNIAVFDAVNAIAGHKYRYYAFGESVKAGASERAAVVSAAYQVALASLWDDPPQAPALRKLYDDLFLKGLASIPDNEARQAGLIIGYNSAAAILHNRYDDGSRRRSDRTYSPGTLPGDYRLTPPGFLPADKPAWGDVKLFALKSHFQFTVPGPLPIGSPQYAADFNEVKSLGAKESTTRTPEQKYLAQFWAEQTPGTRSPPGSWIAIAMTIAKDKKTTLFENARLFALLGIAMADSGIASWEVKYSYNRWRPVTAIRLASTTDNPNTAPDPNWDSLLPAPNFPAYFSGHSNFGWSAAVVIAEFFKTDTITFTCDSTTVPGTRTYTSLSKAADDNGRARIWLGVHMQHENVDSAEQGRKIGHFVFANYLTPR